MAGRWVGWRAPWQVGAPREMFVLAVGQRRPPQPPQPSSGRLWVLSASLSILDSGHSELEHPPGHPPPGVHTGKLTQGGGCRDSPESCSEPLAEADKSQVLWLPCKAEGAPGPFPSCAPKRELLTCGFCTTVSLGLTFRALACTGGSEDTCEENESLPCPTPLTPDQGAPCPAPR